MLDALLIKLNYREVLSGEREFDLGTAYLAGALRQAGFQVEIIDASLEELTKEMLLERIISSPARLIGLSVWLHRLVGEAEQLVRELRLRGIKAHITMGSHSPTFLYRELLENNPGLDSVVCGEGEPTIVELLTALAAEREWRNIPGVASYDADRIIYKPRAACCALDELAPPALDYAPLVKERGQFMSLLTSRGCYGRCTFCSTSPFYRLGGGKAWRAHSPERVLAEFVLLHREYGFTHFGVRDDNFVGPGAQGRERAQAIAEGILREGLAISFKIACRVNDIDRDLFASLKQAGLARVFLGVESGSQRRLDGFKKGVTIKQNTEAMLLLTELGLPYTVGYIMFAPDTSWAEFRESSAFLKHALGSVEGITEAVHDMFNPVEVLPGTVIAEELSQKGLLLGDYRGFRYRFQDWRVRVFYQGLVGIRRLVAFIIKVRGVNTGGD
ncbi:MAG: cobalamin-dependent protein [Peptococcaceae bacterium]|nr:cobalamin-dependent protein [Peptococcaceae bacterium]